MLWTKLSETLISFSVTMPPVLTIRSATATPDSVISRFTMPAVSLRCDTMVPLVLTIRSLIEPEVCSSLPVTEDVTSSILPKTEVAVAFIWP